VTSRRARRILREKVIDSHPKQLRTTMNATHPHTHRNTSDEHTDAIDWLGQCKLAVVLSVAVAIASFGLVGRMSDTSFVVGVIVVASAVAWSRIEPAQPAAVAARRR